MYTDGGLQPWGSLTAPPNAVPVTPQTSNGTIDPRCLDLSFTTTVLSTPPSCASSSQRCLLSDHEADLQRLLCLTRCSPIGCDTAAEMADFLASFNFGSNETAHPDEAQCKGIDDVQATLGKQFDFKVTRTRAEHIVETITLTTKAQLALRLTSTENEAFQSLVNLDPSLGGIPSRTQPAQEDGDLFVRMIQTSDATTNQGQNPVLQKLVAQHLVNAINTVDGSAWILRDMSCTETGWVFMYICRDSLEHWKRYAKPTKDLRIAEYSLNEPKGAVGERPSFDCRGSLTISFIKGDKTIAMKYIHTPFHRTVAQVYDIFRPAPRQITVTAQPKTPKNPRTPSSVSRKRKGPNVDGPAEMRSKSQKRNCNAAAQNGGSSQAPGGEAGNAINVDDPADVASEAQVAVASAKTNGVPSYSRLMATLAPPELERRREAANKLLSDAGIDVSTLSSEQFNIFCNQPPNLQMESVDMLLRYGAERLRIVNPEPSKSPAPATETPVPVPDIPGQSSPSNAKRSSEPAINGTSQAAQKSIRKLGKSRLVCSNCKNEKGKAKTKCSKERPSCSHCLESSLICEYPPSQPRKSKCNVEASDNQDGSVLDAEHGSDQEADETMEDADNDDEAVLSLATATANYPEAATSSYANHTTHSTAAAFPNASIYPDPPSDTAPGRRSRAISDAVQSSQAAQQSAAEGAQYFRSSSLALPLARVVTTSPGQSHRPPAESLHRLYENMMMQQQHVMPQRSPEMTSGQRAAMASAPYQRTPPPRGASSGHAYPAPPDTSANSMYANRVSNARPWSGMSLMEQRAASHLVQFQNSQQASGQSWSGSPQSRQDQYSSIRQHGASDEPIAYEPFLFHKHSNWMQGTSPPTNKARPEQGRR